jgi:hypothetical protein
MPAPLPIRPARQRFYDVVTIIDIAPGQTVDGDWIPGTRTERQILGSFQSPQPISVSMQPSGDAGVGMRELFTREALNFYDVDNAAQTLVQAEGVLWRITDRRYWGPISQGLFVYECERYEEPAANAT